MPEKSEQRAGTSTPRPVKKTDRLQREADALRANLRKRKDQARERAVERPLPKQD